LVCWLGSYFGSKPGTQGGDYGQARPPLGKFIAVTAGGFHTCGLRENLTAECWGRQDQPPEGKYTAISAGNWHTCALRFDGGVTCWGMSKGVVVPPGPFVAISSGGSHACGLRPDGTAVCWGDNSEGQAAPP
jgi:hypothetical protein